MRISDGSSDVCSSDLLDALAHRFQVSERGAALDGRTEPGENLGENCLGLALRQGEQEIEAVPQGGEAEGAERAARKVDAAVRNAQRSEEHTSELQSLMRISYAVCCLKKTNNTE